MKKTKKGVKGRLEEEIVQMEPVVEDSLICPEAQGPKISPYKDYPVAFLIGHNEVRYHIARPLLSDTKWHDVEPDTFVALQDVDEDTGHTLFHYLYTSTYETLQNDSADVITYHRTELSRALSAFIVAEKYDLNLLRYAAMERARKHGDLIGMIEVFDTIKADFAKLDHTAYLREFHFYLKELVEKQFEADHTIFQERTFLESIGTGDLNSFIMGKVLELYNTKLTESLEKEKERGEAVHRLEETVAELQNRSLYCNPAPTVEILEDYALVDHDQCSFEFPSAASAEEPVAEKPETIELDSGTSCLNSDHASESIENQPAEFAKHEESEVYAEELAADDVRSPAVDKVVAEPVQTDEEVPRDAPASPDDGWAITSWNPNPPIPVHVFATQEAHPCEPTGLPEPVPETVPEEPPAPELDPWGFSTPAVGKVKKKKKLRRMAESPEPPPPPPPEPEPSVFKDNEVEPMAEEAPPPPEDPWSLGLGSTTKKKKKKKTMWGAPRPPTPPAAEEADAEKPAFENLAVDEPVPVPEPVPVSAPVPVPEPEQDHRVPDIPTEQAKACPQRARHLLENEAWRTCDQCRAILQQVALHIASGSRGELLDGLL